jgi:hypothetical protein
MLTSSCTIFQARFRLKKASLLNMVTVARRLPDTRGSATSSSLVSNVLQPTVRPTCASAKCDQPQTRRSPSPKLLSDVFLGNHASTKRSASTQRQSREMRSKAHIFSHPQIVFLRKIVLLFFGVAASAVSLKRNRHGLWDPYTDRKLQIPLIDHK